MTAQELINERQQLSEAVKTKVVKCTDRTQLCAAIYPWVSHLVREYEDMPTTQYSVDSFRNEIYDFHQALSVHLLAIPRVVSGILPSSLERIRYEALWAAMEMAISVANLEVDQFSIKLSDIMARFVEDLS